MTRGEAGTSSAADTGGLLMLEHVARDPDVPSRVVGEVRVAGYRQRLVVDTDNPLGIIEYIEVPLLLGSHDPSLHAVAVALGRWAAGEQVDVPLDLSDEVRDSDPPFPLRQLTQEDRDRLEAAADRVDVQVLAVRRSGAVPGEVAASLVVDGVPMDVHVEFPPGEPDVMRWIDGPATGQLGPAVLHAIRRALLALA